MPTRIFYAAGTTDEIHWKDITPRFGAAYDLFGNGKTAIKVNVGKYLTALTASNSDLDLNPLIRTALNTTRTWNDANRQLRARLRPRERRAPTASAARWTSRTSAKRSSRSPSIRISIHGWGKRTYNWEMGISMQQELLPRLGVTVGYYRRSFGNFYTSNNRNTTTADYTPFSIPIPVDPRLPGGGGGTVTGLYNLVPAKVGQEDMLLAARLELRRDGRELAGHGREPQRAAAQRPDRAGRHELRPAAAGQLRGQGGAARDVQLGQHARRANDAGHDADGSTATAGMQNYSCRVVEPLLTSFRGLATYVVPKVDLQVSGTWRSDPGDELRADYVVTNAIAAPSLGRNLSSGNVTVNLIPRGTLYAARRNNIDVRIAKILRFGTTRTQVGVDIYNLMNSDAVTTFNNGYSPTGAWLTPTGIATARYARLNLQLDF